MTTIARKVMNQSSKERMGEWTLGAVQRDQNWEKEETAYIFEDGSALVFNSMSDVRVVTNYGLNSDNEQL